MNIKAIYFLLLTLLFTTSCNSQNAVDVLKPVEFNQQISNTANAIVIDVRTAEEYAGGFIANAINIDYRSAAFEEQISTLDKTKMYYVYCLSGMRSAAAADLMRSKGFKHICNLDGGMLAWQANNFPVSAISTGKNSTAAAEETTLDNYQKMITSDTMVLVDFYAPWCAPCIKMKPMLEQLAKEYAGKVKIERIDISKNKELAKQLNVMEIPLFRLFKQGKEVWVHEGYIEKAGLEEQF